ncbi:hypothetical protein ABIA38_001758 [Embleya sp. AB8]
MGRARRLPRASGPGWAVWFACVGRGASCGVGGRGWAGGAVRSGGPRRVAWFVRMGPGGAGRTGDSSCAGLIRAGASAGPRRSIGPARCGNPGPEQSTGLVRPGNLLAHRPDSPDPRPGWVLGRPDFPRGAPGSARQSADSPGSGPDRCPSGGIFRVPAPDPGPSGAIPSMRGGRIRCRGSDFGWLAQEATWCPILLCRRLLGPGLIWGVRARQRAFRVMWRVGSRASQAGFAAGAPRVLSVRVGWAMTPRRFGVGFGELPAGLGAGLGHERALGCRWREIEGIGARVGTEFPIGGAGSCVPGRRIRPPVRWLWPCCVRAKRCSGGQRLGLTRGFGRRLGDLLVGPPTLIQGGVSSASLPRFEMPPV